MSVMRDGSGGGEAEWVTDLGPEVEVVAAVDAPRGGVTVGDGPVDVELAEGEAAAQRPDLAEVEVGEGPRALLHAAQDAAQVWVDGVAEVGLEQHDVGLLQALDVQEVAHLHHHDEGMAWSILRHPPAMGCPADAPPSRARSWT